MRDFRTIKAWQKSHQLTLMLYKLTRNFPKDELYGLTGQIRRSAASIGCNIAEGCGRASNTDFARFLTIAMGSATELEYQLMLSHDLEFLSHSEYAPLFTSVIEVKKMLTAFIRKLTVEVDSKEQS